MADSSGGGAKSGAVDAPSGAVVWGPACPGQTGIDPQLARLVARWNSLDDATRAAIMRLVDEAT
jgi:hypothetical protein